MDRGEEVHGCWLGAKPWRQNGQRAHDTMARAKGLCEQEAGGSSDGPKRRRTYIFREREEAEQRLIDDYFGDDEYEPKYPEEKFRRRYTCSIYSRWLLTIAGVYGFWKHVSELDMLEIRRLLPMFYALNYQKSAESIPLAVVTGSNLANNEDSAVELKKLKKEMKRMEVALLGVARSQVFILAGIGELFKPLDHVQMIHYSFLPPLKWRFYKSAFKVSVML
ncbi:hypothetical protein Tco_0950676 [Tanacetum coccineum]